MTELGVVYTIWQNDGSQTDVQHEDAPLIVRAMKLWVTEKRDSWLSVYCPSGQEFGILASTITTAKTSTEAQRAEAAARAYAMEVERLEHRRAAGFIESEP